MKKETFAEASTGGKIWKVVSHGWTQDIHDVIITNKTVAEIHSNAEVFEPRVEYAFMYLQVRTTTRCSLVLESGPVFRFSPTAAMFV